MWLCICLKMEVKISVIKNIRIHVDGAKPIAFLPLSSLVRLPNYCLTNLCTSMLISRFLVSSLFSFLLYFRKRVLLVIRFFFHFNVFKFNVFHFTPQVKPFFNRERNVKPKLFGTKNAMQRQILTFVKL